MNCRYATGLISEYVDGTLADSVKAELELHFDECAACTAEVAATRRIVASLGSLGGQRSPVDFRAGVQARVIAVEQARAPWWRWVFRPIVAAPAAAVMAILALLLVWPIADQAPMATDKAYAPEYSYYIGAHSHLQRRQAFADADTIFAKAELQKASLVSEAEE